MTVNFGVPLVKKTSEIDLSVTSGPYGTHDTLRNGFFSASHTLAPKHPLQTSLASIEQVEETRKMFIAKSTLGSHIPLRLKLEKEIANSVKMKNITIIPIISILEWSFGWIKIKTIDRFNCRWN